LQFTDALLSNFDVSLNINNNLRSRLIFLEVNGYQLIALELADIEIEENDDLKKGRVFYFNLNGAYLDGYSVDNFITISRYVKPQHVSEYKILPSFISSLFLQSDDCDEELNPGSQFCEDDLDTLVISVPAPVTGASGPSFHFSNYWTPSFMEMQPGERNGGGGRVGCPPGQIKLPNGSCADIACTGDPLSDMKILGTKNNGIPGGRYGNGRGRFHDGTDFSAPYGTPVFAAHSGSVARTPFQDDWKPGDNSAGNRIYISSLYNGGNLQLGYWHLGEVLVSPGDFVSEGQLIGYTGPSGNVISPYSSGPHLHIRARFNGAKVDPEDYLEAVFNNEGINTNNCN
jgi:hypothetical protein